MYPDMMKAAVEWQRATLAGARVMISAGTVIQVRVAQMAMGTMKPVEATRMVFEKPSAFMRATEAAMRAAAGQKGYGAVMEAALAPIEASAGANARRLSPKTLTKGKRRRS
ncbi:MAG: hypothetical protein ACU0CC_01615 [Sagittula sp.]|jgi:hypothetical protein|uniref:antibiotic ABC transporter n=2 Tax=Sagittula TaxID=58842 RepID=UPI000C2CE723|nr:MULTISPECIES: antibiotic ABC transporter [unclassified Sagittula]AUC54671.1 antibiotic ABC transporter [Sagittula sp. P11]WHZ33974.1 antibiotic ABC transporter [Sagittula sp. MA-2]